MAMGSNLRRDLEMDDTTIDRDAMGRLAKTLAMLEGQALSTLSNATFCVGDTAPDLARLSSSVASAMNR